MMKKEKEYESNLSMDDEIMEDNTISSDSDKHTESCEFMLKNAKDLKETGNDNYKKGKYEDAKINYEKGLDFIEKISQKDEDFGGNELEELRQTLQLNVSMIYLKNEEWSKAINVTGQVLKKDSKNLKALYRRGLGRLGFGMYEESKEDFQTLLKLDPNNIDAQKQLRIVRQKIIEDNEKSKSGFSKMFHGGLYSDKQEAVEKKKKKEREQRIENYNKYLSQIKAKNSELGSDDEEEEPMPFEEWEKKELEKEKEMEKIKENEKKIKDSKESKPSTIISNKNTNEVELDDEDIKILEETKKMGYCYFKRELTEQEKELNKQFKPTLIDNHINQDQLSSNLYSSDIDKSRTGISSWNSKGTTFEDKDISETAKSSLKRIFTQNNQFSGKFNENIPLNILLENIENISGEASLAMIRGTRRFLFDFSLTLKCFYTLDNKDDEKYYFDVNIPSLTSMCNEDDIFGIKDSSVHFIEKHKHKYDLNQIKSYIINNFCYIHLKDSINALISEMNSQ